MLAAEASESRLKLTGNSIVLAVDAVESIQARGMEDYRLDEVEAPARHPSAVRRLTGRRRSPGDYSGGELPGRRVDPRR
jgi:hypothetical protein